MRRWGYVIALFCIIAPSVVFAGVSSKPARGVPAVDSIGHAVDTLGFDTVEELVKSIGHLSQSAQDSILIATGICDTAMTYCDFPFASHHPDSLHLGEWRLTGKRDTLHLTPEERTQRFYDTLQNRARRNKFWGWVHGIVIAPQRSAPLRDEVVDETAAYSEYNGKRIAAIEIERHNVFDPAHSYLEKAANAVHVVTRQYPIKRDLLFHEGDLFDADQIVRYKQLLRSRQYIATANIEVVPLPEDPDAVVVKVITRDNWSISGDGSVRGLTGRVKGELFDANFLGTGDRLSYQLSLDWRRGRYEGSMLRYYVPNVFGTFYEARLTAGRSFQEKYYGASLNKKFIQPTDHEVGLIVENVRTPVYVHYENPADTVDASYMVHYDNLDVWGGGSWYVPGTGGSVYAMGRVNGLRYHGLPQRIDEEEPPRNPPELTVGTGMNPYFYDRILSLASVGFYEERFLTTNLIYGYGYDEYVATGYRAELTVGYLHNKFQPGWYGGLLLRAGRFTPAGYVMGNVSVGSFYDFCSRSAFGSALNIKVNYFTNMLGNGRFKVRQFLSADWLKGWNRASGFYESVWFTHDSGPRELKSSPTGNNRFVLSAETVVFTPWQPIGFRMALYCYADVGFLGYGVNPFANPCYATIGVGVRMKNEMLIFDALQLSFFVNIGGRGFLPSDWVTLTNEQRMRAMRYIPEKPQIVDYR